MWKFRTGVVRLFPPQRPKNMKNSIRQLFVWEASVDLAVRMVEVADRLIAKRRFAVADQIVRSSFSVPSNIAEGQGRSTTPDRRHFLVQARGSLYELETQLEIITRAGLEELDPIVRSLIARIGIGITRMITRYPSEAGRPGGSEARASSESPAPRTPPSSRTPSRPSPPSRLCARR
jgi:four helix bundle protein